MSKTKNKDTVITPESPSISQQDQIRAALNLPTGQFQLGSRVFDIKDLSYDSYMEFISCLTPLIDLLVGKISQSQGVKIPGIDLGYSAFSPAAILSLCGDALPKMVQLMCAETDPEITVEEVKFLAGKPTVLVTAVIRQIKQNDMIKDFTDFFVQVVSAFKK